jgi:hypothetical protein
MGDGADFYGQGANADNQSGQPEAPDEATASTASSGRGILGSIKKLFVTDPWRDWWVVGQSGGGGGGGIGVARSVVGIEGSGEVLSRVGVQLRFNFIHPSITSHHSIPRFPFPRTPGTRLPPVACACWYWR